MGALQQIVTKARGWLSVQHRGAVTMAGALPWLGEIIAGTRNAAVDSSSALSLPALYAACSIYSSVAALRWRIVRRMADGTPEPVIGTDAARAIALMPYDAAEGHLFLAALLGNSYARLKRNLRGGVAEIELLAPWRVSLASDRAGDVWYRIAADASTGQPDYVLPAADVWHLRFRISSSNPLLGVAPLASCSPAFAAALQQRETMLSLLENVGLPGVILTTPKPLTPEQRTQLRETWNASTQGMRRGSTVVLSSELKPTGLDLPSASDAQLIEGMRFSVLEVARCYNLPPSVLAQTEHVSFAAAAEEVRLLVSLALRPWAYRVADSLAGAVLSPEERMAGTEVEVDTSSLTMGSGKELSESLSALVNGGIMAPNEARAKLNLGPIAGGESLGRPVNTMDARRWREHVGATPAKGA